MKCQKNSISNDPLLLGVKVGVYGMREQGVWGEATHTREMCACARFLKSGNEGYSKENRQNRDSEKVDHELPFHSLLFFL